MRAATFAAAALLTLGTQSTAVSAEQLANSGMWQPETTTHGSVTTSVHGFMMVAAIASAVDTPFAYEAAGHTTRLDFTRPYLTLNAVLETPARTVGQDALFAPRGSASLSTDIVPVARPHVAAPTREYASPAIAAKAPNRPLLGSLGKTAGFTPVSARWDRVQHKTAGSLAALNACIDKTAHCADADLADWAAIVAEARGMREGRRITHVNRAINRLIAYRDDRIVWKNAEYWAAPAETLARKAGDCEDFAILKYWSLREAGFRDQDMRIVVLRDKALRRYHAVLAVYHNNDWLILDNRFSRVRLQRDLPNYQPLFSLNASTQWAHATTTKKPVRLASRLASRLQEQFGQ